MTTRPSTRDGREIDLDRQTPARSAVEFLFAGDGTWRTTIAMSNHGEIRAAEQNRTASQVV